MIATRIRELITAYQIGDFTRADQHDALLLLRHLQSELVAERATNKLLRKRLATRE